MKMKILELSLLFFSVVITACSLLFNPWFLLGLTPFVYLLYLSVRRSIKQRGVDIQNKMEELSGGKIWSLKVNTVCPHCNSDFSHEFDLGTREVVCPHCGKTSKLVVDITPIPQ